MASLRTTTAGMALLLSACTGAQAPPASSPAGASTLPDPTTSPSPSGRVSSYLGAAAWSAKAAAGGIWVQVDPPVDQLLRVDGATGEVAGEVDGGRGLGTDGETVWVARGPAGVAQVDPTTADVLMEIPDARASYVAVGGGSVWTTTDVAIERWDAASGDLLASIPVEVREFTELLYAHDALWVTAKEDGLLLRVDPETNTVAATIETGAGAHGIAADATSIWVTNYRANTVSRVDPTTNGVAATVEDVGSGVGITAGADAIWVSTQGTGISRIDPATDEATVVLELPFEWHYGLAVDGGALWVTTVEGKSVFRYEIADLGT